MKQERILKLVKIILGWPFSLIAIFFLAKIVVPKTLFLIPHLKNINILGVFFGVVSFIIYFFLRGYLWHTILKFKGHFIPLKDTVFLWGYSELKRYVPGSIWSFLGRAVSFNNKGVGKKQIAHALIIEAQLIVLGCSLLSIFSLFLLKDLFFPLVCKQLIIAIVLLAVFIFIIHNVFPNMVNKRFLKYILPGFMPKQNLYVLLLSVAAFSFFGLGTYLVSSSFFYLDLKYVLGFISFFVFSLLVGYVSIVTPMGLGVREGVITLGLSKIMPLEFAGFISIFSRIVFIISEVIFISLAFIWMQSKNKLLIKLENIIRNNKQMFVLAVFICIYIVYFTVASFFRYDNFYTGRFDLGNMDQTVWNTINGRVFQTSTDNGLIISRLASHADFILVLLSPSYSLWPHPKMLLLIQSVVLGLGAIFVFLIAKKVLENKNLALVLAFLYLMNPAVQFTNLYDFHSVTIATTTLLATFYFLLTQRYFLMVLFLILSGLAKEQIWIITSIFGLFLFFKTKKSKILGLGITLISLLIFGYLIWIAIPNSSGGQHFALSYYSNFGNSPGEVIKNVLLSPQKIFSTILDGERINYLNQIFIPLGFISLLSPLYLIFAIPDLLINLMSNNSQLHQIYYQYSAAITPFIFISGIFGVKQFTKWFPKNPKLYILIYLIFFTFISSYFIGPLPGSKNPNIDMFTKPKPNKEKIEDFLSKIPENYSVAATNNLGSHLSHRQKISTIPFGIDKADVVLFLDGQKEMVGNLRLNKNYIEVLRIDDFIVFKKQGNML